MTNLSLHLQRISNRFKERENTSELREELKLLMSILNEEKKVDAEPYTIGAMISERYKELMDQERTEKQILKTGFEDYDSEFGGIIKGELTVIGGRPAMGKTTFMINLCSNIARNNKAVAFISMELSDFQIANRFISHFSIVPSQLLIKGKLNNQDVISVSSVIDKLTNLPIFIYDQYNSSVFNIIERCNNLANKYNVEAIFIDYLQMITTHNKRYNREAELSFITRELRKLAKELNIAIVASSQLSRQLEYRPGGSKRPQLSDLRESGAIEQDADKVLFLYRPEYYGLEVDENNEPTKNVMEVIMAKNKTGSLETIKLSTEKYFSGFKKYNGPFDGLGISENRLEDLN